MRKLYLSVIAAAVTAAPVSAQICTGYPTVDGQKAITAAIGFPDGGKEYTLTGAVDLLGPLSINGGLAVGTIDDVDDKAYGGGVNVAYELKGLSFSACPVVGASYSRLKSEGEDGSMTVSSFDFPIGFGVGQTFAAGNGSFGIYAVPQFVISRGKAEIEIEDISVDETETDTYFGANIGALYKIGSFFAGGGVYVSSLEDSDAVFSVNLGVLLGRR